MKTWMKMLLLPVALFGIIAAVAAAPAARELYRREYGPPRETVPGTEEVYEGIVADRAMSRVDTAEYERPPVLDESRAYIGVAFDGGGGNCFWMADEYEEAERARPGDRVRIETAEEKATGLRVVTRIVLLEKLSF